jgi:hypothetical protein
VHSIKYDETFAPIAKMDSIILALSIVVAKGWEFHHMDMKNVFIHGDLYGESPRIYARFIFGLSTEEVSLWPQADPKGVVFQDGILPVVT